jgi:hypothetical protein
MGLFVGIHISQTPVKHLAARNSKNLSLHGSNYSMFSGFCQGIHKAYTKYVLSIGALPVMIGNRGMVCPLNLSKMYPRE